MEISQRIQRLKTSPVRKLNPYAEEAVKKGIKIYHLNIGQPDIETPKVFFEAISKYNGKTLKYEHSRGMKPLINKIQEYYEKKIGVHYEEDEINITNGGSEGLLFSLLAIFDEGDEILVAEPYYANYNSFYDVLDIKRNAVRTYAEQGFHLPNRDEIEKHITPKTKAYMFSNPSNPTGVVSTKEEYLQKRSLMILLILLKSTICLL